MGTFPVAVALTESGGPIFLQIARAIVADVRRGRLRPLTRLPGSRALADQLGVHRNTVLAAYRELHLEGWIVTEKARGTFVSNALPEVVHRRLASRAVIPSQARERIGFALPMVLAPRLPPRRPARGVLSLNGGIPD